MTALLNRSRQRQPLSWVSDSQPERFRLVVEVAVRHEVCHAEVTDGRDEGGVSEGLVEGRREELKRGYLRATTGGWGRWNTTLEEFLRVNG